MINLSSIAQLLRPGVKAIINQMPTYPEQWTDIYKTMQSDKYQEIIVEMKGLGLADIKTEGSPILMDSMGQRIVNTFTHLRVGLGFEITREAIEDNLYPREFPEQAMNLRNSLRSTKNILGANLLNNAFNAAYAVADGQALCSTTHPIDGGTYANAFGGGGVYVDFSEAGVEQAIIAIQKFPMQSGILANIQPKKLIIPRELQFAASRLLDSAFRVDVANNDINALYHNNYIPQGFRVNQYLTSTAAWFVLNDAENGLIHFQRTAVETDTYADFNTDNVKAKAIERYSFGAANYRGIFGSPGV